MLDAIRADVAAVRDLLGELVSLQRALIQALAADDEDEQAYDLDGAPLAAERNQTDEL